MSPSCRHVALWATVGAVVACSGPQVKAPRGAPRTAAALLRQAMGLRKLFEYVADRLGLHCEAVITDGRQPVGRGIGPVLEARDVMQVLEGQPAAPPDLREKSLRLVTLRMQQGVANKVEVRQAEVLVTTSACGTGFG